MTRSVVIGPAVDIDMGGNKITNVADGVAADDVATVGQLGGGGGAVSSVFGRTGAVVAAPGDYTASDVGAQPVDSDLTAIAALSTTSFGRGLLALADAAALRTAAALGTAATNNTGDFDTAGAAAAAQAASQPLDSDLTAVAGLSPANDDVIQRKAGVWTNRTMANLLADLAAVGTTFQPLDSDLTAIAALATTSFGRSVLTQADAAALRTLAGLGSLATLSTITSAEITDGTITDADVAAANKDGAAGTASLRTLGTGATQAAAGNDSRLSDTRTPTDNSVTSAKIVDGAIVNADVNASAAIAYSKLALAASLVAGDLSAALTTSLAPWTVVPKTGDESVASSTTVQDDNELFFTAASGITYEGEILIVYVSTAGGGTPDIKIAFGEDNTLRGSAVTVGLNTADSSVVSAGNTALSNQPTYGTAATNRLIHVRFWHTGAGGTFKLQWAQATSGINATVVKAGSLLRYRVIV